MNAVEFSMDGDMHYTDKLVQFVCPYTGKNKVKLYFQPMMEYGLPVLKAKQISTVVVSISNISD